MRKHVWTFALLALPFTVAHACGGDDTMPAPSGTSAAATGGSGATTGASCSAAATTTGTGGSAGRR